MSPLWLRKLGGRPLASRRPSISASPWRARSNTCSAKAAVSSSVMVAGVGWLDIWNLLAEIVAQVFVRQGCRVKGSDSIGPIVGGGSCNMHCAKCTTVQVARQSLRKLNVTT
ncbi:protein of unknown function [Pseudomonas inefficax]|uniref:Uncharacterized protein n=1 Tax=Pseudomonas inefficax TaxID=2078786 RepID=A0AAQ1P6G1_9PSED|nr:protein of unknown function [Pseudomonas inefficax]